MSENVAAVEENGAVEEAPVTEQAIPEKKSLLTPFNIFAAIVIVVGLYLTFERFVYGLGAVTNLDDNNPWGFWIGFDLLSGVALAAGGYVTSAAIYIFGLKRFHFAVRPAILTGFLGYFFFVIALIYDLGRPWRLPYPYSVSPGPNSVMFEVGLCVMLYLTVLFIEFSPAALEWLGLKKIRNLVVKLTLVLTIFGVVLSTLHQSSLGAMFLMYPSKIHPLWYSQFIPIYFFISSIIAGLSMVIFEGWLTHRHYGHLSKTDHSLYDDFVLSFGKAAAMVLAGYFMIKVIGITVDHNWHYLFTGYGAWFLVEMLGFVLLPCFLYTIAFREKNVKLTKIAALLTVIGIVVNRVNIATVSFNWQLPSAERYFPHWKEIWLSVFIVTVGLVVFRFIVSRMPILYEHPDYEDHH